MIFEPELNEGRLLKRYKRFFADLETPSGPITVHVPNTGSLKGCLETQSPCLFSVSTDPKRKLKGTLQFIHTKTSWVGVNTALPNTLVEELYLDNPLPHWQNFKAHRREVKINPKSRIDLMLARTPEDLESRTHCHFIEVKNVTLAEGTCAQFPDAVTERGQKHLEDLMDLIAQGHSAEIVFVVQREDCTTFSPCKAIDPKYAALLKTAHDHGVKITALPCVVTPKKGVALSSTPLELIL